jgi:hypothetical protein
MNRLIDKAQTHAQDHGIDEADLLSRKLADDMLPLGYQFKSCWTHSAHALAGVKQGQFSPEMSPPPTTFDGCREKIAAAMNACEAVSVDDLEAIADNPMVFTIQDKFRLEFTVKGFLLSFSVPNFHFHAATAYDILRAEGLAIGKQDYLGRMRLAAG